MVSYKGPINEWEAKPELFFPIADLLQATLKHVRLRTDDYVVFGKKDVELSPFPNVDCILRMKILDSQTRNGAVAQAFVHVGGNLLMLVTADKDSRDVLVVLFDREDWGLTTLDLEVAPLEYAYHVFFGFDDENHLTGRTSMLKVIESHPVKGMFLYAPVTDGNLPLRDIDRKVWCKVKDPKEFMVEYRKCIRGTSTIGGWYDAIRKMLLKKDLFVWPEVLEPISKKAEAL